MLRCMRPCKASGDPSTVIGMTYVSRRARSTEATDWEARFLSKRLKTLVYSRVNTNRHPLLVPYPTCNSLYLFIVYIVMIKIRLSQLSIGSLSLSLFDFSPEFPFNGQKFQNRTQKARFRESFVGQFHPVTFMTLDSAPVTSQHARAPNYCTHAVHPLHAMPPCEPGSHRAQMSTTADPMNVQSVPIVRMCEPVRAMAGAPS